MVFEDLTDYDLSLIKSLAINLLINTKISNRYEALAETVLGCIYAKGFKIAPYPQNLVLVISKSMTPPVGWGAPKEPSAIEIIRDIFVFLKSENIEILKDDRQSTWSGPRASWYTEYVNHKKPWMF